MKEKARSRGRETGPDERNELMVHKNADRAADE